MLFMLIYYTNLFACFFKAASVKSQKSKPGSPGRLQVDAFNLLKNTVQKLEVPTAEGSTLFVIGGNHLNSYLLFFIRCRNFI